MNTRHALVIALVLSIAPAAAADRSSARELARLSGLSESQVRMVLNGRTAHHHRFPQYFDRVERRLIEAIGRDNFTRLTEGETIVMRRTQAPTRIATVDTRR